MQQPSDPLKILASSTDITQGDIVQLAALNPNRTPFETTDDETCSWSLSGGPEPVPTIQLVETETDSQLDAADPRHFELFHSSTVYWSTANLPPGLYTVRVAKNKLESATWVEVGNTAGQLGLMVKPRASMAVTMARSQKPITSDVSLWAHIRRSSDKISFSKFDAFMKALLCEEVVDSESVPESTRRRLTKMRRLPFNDTDVYRIVKVATEAFVEVSCDVVTSGGKVVDPFGSSPFDSEDAQRTSDRVGTRLSTQALQGLARAYVVEANLMPYMGALLRKLRPLGLHEHILREWPDQTRDSERFHCEGVDRKRAYPCLIELIWSYWHEEGMLVQTLNAIARRFQNVRGPGASDPLANVEIGTWRPAGPFLWGYIQDEQHRLSLIRRAYEYDHHYGISIQGRAVGAIRGADSRSRFLEAFHNLLYLCNTFFKEDDDTTIVADGFPVLNALKEVHLLLSEGAHNQFGDLPSTARQEMLVQQWILARPEFREYLPTRQAVAYPEPWMERVDAMKSLQGWTDVSVLHFRNLGTFGERILLAIRYGNWNDVEDPNQASNWARFWRQEIQGYTHAYRSVTGVDLTAEVTDSVQATARYLPPAVHLQRRMAAQQRAQLGTGSYDRAGSMGVRMPVRRSQRRF